MTWSPARKNRATNGVVFQMSTAAIAAKEVRVCDPRLGLRQAVQPSTESLKTP